MNVRNLIGRIPPRLLIGLLGLGGAIVMAYGFKILVWLLKLFA